MEPEPEPGDLPDWVIVDISRPPPTPLSPALPTPSPAAAGASGKDATPAAGAGGGVLPAEWRARLAKVQVLGDLLKMSSGKWSAESSLSPPEIAQLEVFVEWLGNFVSEAAAGRVGAPKEAIEKICEFQIVACLHTDVISEAPLCKIKTIFLRVLKIPPCVPKIEKESIQSDAGEEFDSYFYDDQIVLKRPVMEGFWIDYGFYDSKERKDASIVERKAPVMVGDVKARATRKVESVMEPEESKHSSFKEEVSSGKGTDVVKSSVVSAASVSDKSIAKRLSADKGLAKHSSSEAKDIGQSHVPESKEAIKSLTTKRSAETTHVSETSEKVSKIDVSLKESSAVVDEGKSASDSSIGKGELQEKMLQIVGLVLRDWLGNGQDSPMLLFLNNFIEEILLTIIPRSFEDAEKAAVVEKDKILALDFRVVIIKHLEELSQDYLSVLKRFQSSKKTYQDTKPKTPEKSLEIIRGLIKSIQARGSYSVFDEFKYGKDFSDVKSFEESIGKIEHELVAKICKKIVLLLKPDPKVASALEKLFEQALSALLAHASSDSAFWLMLIHKIPHMDLPTFPEASSKPDVASPSKSMKDQSFAVDLGSEVVHLLSNLIDLANPQGMAGFLASVGKQILKAYIERVGKALVQELRTPVSWRRILWACELAKGLLWNPNGSGDFVFLTQISMYKKVKEDVEKGRTADIEEAVIHELAELIYGKVLDSVPKKLGFIKGSLKSVHMAIWWLIRLLVDITQSPLLMRFVVVQYILQPASQM